MSSLDDIYDDGFSMTIPKAKGHGGARSYQVNPSPSNVKGFPTLPAPCRMVRGYPVTPAIPVQGSESEEDIYDDGCTLNSSHTSLPPPPPLVTSLPLPPPPPSMQLGYFRRLDPGRVDSNGRTLSAASGYHENDDEDDKKKRKKRERKEKKEREKMEKKEKKKAEKEQKMTDADEEAGLCQPVWRILERKRLVAISLCPCIFYKWFGTSMIIN